MMNALRRITTVALVTALVAIPTAAFALDDVPTDQAPTDQAPTDRAPTDRAITDRPQHDLREIKARALETIDKQLATLGTLRSKIAGARHITNSHAGQLLGDIGTAAEGLKELARQIKAATTPEELRRLIEHIGDYKIKQVLAPKTFQVIASDSLVYTTGKLERYSEKLQNVIGRFEEAGFDVTEAWRLLDEMNAHISEGYRLAHPVAGNVIGLQAADWPEPAQGILSAGRSDLGAAAKNVKAAHRNGAAIVTFLRGLTDGTDVNLSASD